MPAELSRDASFSAISLLVHDETWTVKFPLPDGGGANFRGGAASLLCFDPAGTGVVTAGVVTAGVVVDGVVPPAGSRLGSGVGVTSFAGAVDPWSVVFAGGAAVSGGGSCSVTASVVTFGALFPQRWMTLK
jgi:hypothetical protein